MTKPLTIDVWSDVMCPFCYMGDALLAKALDTFPHNEQVEVRYRSYQLMPGLPTDSGVNATEILVKAKGIPRAQAIAMNEQVAARAAELGLEYHLDRAVVVNTRSAQRLSQFALAEGKQRAFMQRLFRAYFTEGKNVGKYDVLADLAVEVGLDRARALEVLHSGGFDSDVAADQRQANAIGIRGVPFFVFDGKYAVSGAQPVEAFRKALDEAWGEGRR
ncbi:MAG: DsbA family oxidoreductase [Nannocystaceae bacterium]|nr:DsbA family oxidoreductase [Nannocystaceae bacterium]